MNRWILACLFLGPAVTAFGQVGEISISAGNASFRNNVLGTQQIVDTAGAVSRVNFTTQTNFRLGFRFTMNTYEHFGHEIGYAYNRGSFRQESTPRQEIGMPVHQGIYNFLVYATPEGSSVRPFLAGGGHISTFYPPGTSVFSGNGVTKVGFNYGGGIKMRVSPMFLVRFDVRNYTTGKPFGDIFPDQKGLLHQLEISGGLGFAF